jgi:hypothetical protein
MRLFITGIALAIAASSANASAQSIDDLTVGVRVRIRQVDEKLQRPRTYDGDVVAHDSTRLLVRRDGVGPVDTLPFFAMNVLQMQRGRTTRAKLVAMGAVGGMLTGGVLLLASHLAPVPADDPSPDTRAVRRVAIASVPVLTGVGIIVGSLVDTNLWVSVRFPSSASGDNGR